MFPFGSPRSFIYFFKLLTNFLTCFVFGTEYLMYVLEGNVLQSFSHRTRQAKFDCIIVISNNVVSFKLCYSVKLAVNNKTIERV